MYDIITFGSATKDINLKSKAFKVLKDDRDFVTGEGICLALGSKINIDEIKFTFGGGGMNTAVGFALQGLKTAFCGAIGNDMSGESIVKELKRLKVNTSLVRVVGDKQTNQSVIISGMTSEGTEDRTILAYRGAAEILDKNSIPWNKLKTKWIYLAPLTGLLCDNFEEIVNFAYEHKIKIAVNPSSQQLALPEEQLKRIFKKVDVLFLNQEEASFLTKISFHQEAEIFKKLDQMCPGIAVMTKGGEGVVVSDGEYMYSAKPHPDRKIVDTTGAGDSFASGFLVDYIKSNGDIEAGIQMGLANSEANLSAIGAQTGLLDKNVKFERVKVTKQLCSENNVCVTK